jgi:hypothetical protein
MTVPATEALGPAGSPPLSNQLGVGFFYTLAEIFRGVAAKIYIYQCVLAMAQ